MYLSLSRTGNIFPSWTVVVRRHHVYVPEFHCPSCNSVGMYEYVHCTVVSAISEICWYSITHIIIRCSHLAYKKNSWYEVVMEQK
jgi:hypothetical protein